MPEAYRGNAGQVSSIISQAERRGIGLEWITVTQAHKSFSGITGVRLIPQMVRPLDVDVDVDVDVDANASDRSPRTLGIT